MQELSLFNSSQVEILNFQTFSTEYVASNYGTSQANIRIHKREHADELVENIHFITETNKFGTNEIKWTLRGIIKLGMFIRSKEAKNFRLWAEMELEKSILAELKTAKETKERNLRLIDENNALNLELIDKTKRHKREIATYKGKLTMAKNKLTKYEEALNAEVVEHSGFKDLYLEVSAQTASLRTLLKEARNERDYFRNKYNEIYKILKTDKNKEIVLSLAKIQKELEKNYTAIGAVMSFINDDDRYFLENNEITKG